MILRIALVALAAMTIIMIAVRILIWQWRPQTRPCSWFGHDKKYVAIKTTGCVSIKDPRSNGKPFTCGHSHQIGEENIYVARWVCRRCPKMEEDCLGIGQDWTIRNEQLVPDVKKWANWSQDPPPANNDAAREKLKEIQKRLGPPPPAEDQPRLSDFNKDPVPPPPTPQEKIDRTLLAHDVKIELVKAENYCQTCGWNHDGPCNPQKPCHCGAIHTGPCVPGGIS